MHLIMRQESSVHGLLHVKVKLYLCVVVVQSLSPIRLFATPWTAARQAPLLFIISQVCSESCPLSQTSLLASVF